MHLLVSEASQVPNSGVVSDPANPVNVRLATPLLRPRLQGNREALRGAAYDAKAADYARVQFTVRLPAFNAANVATTDSFNNYQALLSVQQAPLLGQSPEVTFPTFVADVSSDFAIEGRIAVDVAIYGTCRVILSLTRRTAATAIDTTTLFTLTQVFAEQWTLDVTEDGKLRGEE